MCSELIEHDFEPQQQKLVGSDYGLLAFGLSKIIQVHRKSFKDKVIAEGRRNTHCL